MPRISAGAIVFAGSLLSAGCASRAIPPQRRVPAAQPRPIVRAIVPCKTTEADLRRQLGEPTRDGVLHDARIVSWVTQWESPSRYLAVLVDKDGLVTDVYWDVPTEIAWTPTDLCRGR